MIRLLALLIAAAIAAPAFAQSIFDRQDSTHDELFGSQKQLSPSPSSLPQPGKLVAGSRLNPRIGGEGSVSFGQIVTKRIGPADTTQNDPLDTGSHDDLQYSPQQ